MSSRKSFILKALCCFLLAASLTACGYQPLHGKRKTVQNTQMQQELSSIWVREIADREGQILHNELLNLLNPKGRPKNPKYTLTVAYSESSSGLGIGKDEFATRANFSVYAHFTLNGVSNFNGSTQASVSYNILTSPTGTEFAQRDARIRAIKKVAEDIQRRIAVHLLGTKKENNVSKPVRIIE